MTAATPEADLASQVAAHTQLGQAVCEKIRQAAARLGVDLGPTPTWPAASYRQQTDPYSGEVSLIGTWQDGQRYGTVTIFPDQRIFAEYQILAPHPKLPGQFVEAVNVWGTLHQLKSDPVLLAMPE